jgi:uncharacterized protein YecE (DUF72 family)
MAVRKFTPTQFNGMMNEIYIGCSGYSYREWKGFFYPEGLPASKWLEYYCQRYNTVEINASFYKFPEVKGLKTWYNKTPKEFAFAVKAPRDITHFKKFNEVGELMQRFYQVVAEGLEEKLKCVLFQLPPSLPYTQERLEKIVATLDPHFVNIIEFRHVTWWNQEVYSYLKKHNVVFCNISHPTLPEDFIDTGSVCYLRFHGKPELYKSNYTDAELIHWVNLVNPAKTKILFAYFNNTWGGNALANAVVMQNQIKLLV